MLSGHPLLKPFLGLYSCGKLVSISLRVQTEDQGFPGPLFFLQFFQRVRAQGQTWSRMPAVDHFDATLRFTT